ncbi:DUF6916 family protein [Sinorhizobium saheli]|uniref:DUF6916 domain-containing protein n=1 Tax=Sinorhizobium saheli TaxID=36856 RepID=A0A178Y3H3_SINSA|nr:hypothetical protein [Sinorhizobium saheli]MQW89753.1 hypothetical protein [Sinorhizobium saheli]OAP42119.1 hypothetical protein ATB98_06855 [Sinorhizobium saheli]
MDVVSLDRFAPCVGEGFDLDMGTGSLALTLAEASPLPAHNLSRARRSPFSLLFRSGSPIVLPQRIYRLKHARLGSIEVFLVPVARDRSGILYQAIYN